MFITLKTFQLGLPVLFIRWYTVDFDMADTFQVGSNAGCRFTHGSCGEWIATRLTETGYLVYNVVGVYVSKY